MLYAMLIFQAEGAFDHLPTEEREALVAQHGKLQADSKEAEVFVAASRLMGSHTSTVVRRRGETTSVQEGPFAETNEVFVGFYVLDCDNLDSAVAWAKRIPRASVEIRPIAYFEDNHGKVVGE